MRGVQFNEDLWAGWRLMYNQNAVPDYAVSPSNLDFENVGFSLGGRYTIAHWENTLLTDCTGAEPLPDGQVHPKIGRASCRERV